MPSSFWILSNDSTFQLLTIFKILILVFIVITGWVVLSGRTQISDPQANFRNAFSGSSHSGGDVSDFDARWCLMLMVVYSMRQLPSKF